MTVHTDIIRKNQKEFYKENSNFGTVPFPCLSFVPYYIKTSTDEKCTSTKSIYLFLYRIINLYLCQTKNGYKFIFIIMYINYIKKHNINVAL